MFTMLSTLFMQPIFYSDTSDIHFLTIFMSLKRKQLRWMRSNKHLIRLLNNFIDYDHWQTQQLRVWANLCMVILMSKIIKYGYKMEQFGLNKSRIIKMEKQLNTLQPQLIMCKTLAKQHNCSGISCGNNKCKRNYVVDRYGIRDNDDDGLLKWNDPNLKVIKKWYICKGCKTTYYCSRKCQKISWNKYGHRKLCKRLQLWHIMDFLPLDVFSNIHSFLA